MNVRIPRFAPARAGLLGVLAGAVLVGACEARLPTTTEIDRMDVHTATAQANRLRFIGAGDNVTYVVDGKTVSAAEANAIPADRIASVNVRRDGDKGTIEITTGAPGANGTRFSVHRVQIDGAGNVQVDSVRRVPFQMHVPSGEPGPVRISSDTFEGLMVVDGQIVPSSSLRTFEPSRIENIEVIKGAAAAQLYPNDPRAANGVIRITTKR